MSESLTTKEERQELMTLYPSECMPPSGYCDWHDWAQAQGWHGLKSKRCSKCKRYFFPQELVTHDCK